MNIPPVIIDLLFAGLILGLTYALMSEGLWGSALMFFNVLISSIVAFNFYEPLAALIASNVSFLSGLADTICLAAVFLVSLVLLRLTTESIAPSMVRFPPAVYNVGRIGFGLAGATVTVAFVLLLFETAPVHKKVFTAVDYKYAPPFKMGIDREFLGFFQYTTGYIFANTGGVSNDPYREYPATTLFDPKADWLLKHQEARPFGTETVLGGEPAAEGAGGGGGENSGGGAPGGMAGSQGGGSRPGDIKVISPGAGGGVVLPN